MTEREIYKRWVVGQVWGRVGRAGMGSLKRKLLKGKVESKRKCQ